MEALIDWHPTAAYVSVVRQKRKDALSLVNDRSCVRRLRA